MIQKSFYLFGLALITSCNPRNNENANDVDKSSTTNQAINFKSGYSDVNGIKMYYEVYGQGEPLVLIHGGGSTIQTSFGRIIPNLAKDFTLIAVELQNHGLTDARNTVETFEQDADDVALLLKNLGIAKASFFGFSNGGHTAMQISLRHPEIVHKLVIASSPCKRNGFPPGFFNGMQQATLDNMPQELKTAFLKVNPDSARLQIMFERDRDRMINFKDWSDEQIKSIAAPTLLIDGDTDVMTPEHAVEMYRLIPNSQLAIIPGGHGKYMGEITTLSKSNPFVDFSTPLIKEFLNR